MILSTIPIMKLSFKANKAKKREGEGERERERERERCCFQLVWSFCYKCLLVICFRVVKGIGLHLLYIVCV